MAEAERIIELSQAILNGYNNGGIRAEALQIIIDQVSNGGNPNQDLLKALEMGWREEGEKHPDGTPREFDLSISSTK